MLHFAQDIGYGVTAITFLAANKIYLVRAEAKIIYINRCVTQMTGNEFIKKVKNLGKLNKVKVKHDTKRGKGSHGTLYYGTAFTIVRNPTDELKKGTLHAMCDQLGIKSSDL